MKKTILILVVICISYCANGQFSRTITTSQSELGFSTKDGYDLISLPNNQFLDEVGSPKLPVLTFNYVLPVEAEITGIEVLNYSKEQINGTFDIYPAQPLTVPDGSIPPPFAEPNEQIYSSSNPYPGKLTEINADNYIMGFKIVSIKIYPLEYIPISQQVYLYSSIEFAINYTLGTSNPQLPYAISKTRKQSIKDKIAILVDNDIDIDNVSTQFDNIPEDGSNVNLPIHDQYPWNLGVIPDLIVITTEGLKSAFKDNILAKKNEIGIPSVIATLEEDIIGKYEGYDLAEQIRNFILDMSINIGPNLYIILGGDVSVIPARMCDITGHNAPTDLYYSSNPGSWNSNGNNVWGEYSDNVDDYPQNIIGRIPITSENDLINYMKKVEEYRNLLYHDDITNQDINIDPGFIQNFLPIIGLVDDNDNLWAESMEVQLTPPYIPNEISRHKLYSINTSVLTN